MAPPNHTSGRTRIFWGALLATPLAVFAGCEALARLRPPPGDAFLALRGAPVFFEHVLREGEPHVRIVHDELYGAGSTELSAVKPAGTLRIFTLGGSASAGWPLPARVTYPRRLQQALARALPGRSVEVVDASAHAWAAYRVRMVLREVLTLDPDLVVVYSGNNEFLEPRRYLPDADLPAALLRLASVRWLRYALLGWLRPDALLAAEHREQVGFEVWAKLRERALELRSDPVQLARVRAHYVESIEGMVREAGAVGVPVVLVTVPVNLRDWEPNVSADAPAGPAGADFRAHLDRGRRALSEGATEPAVEQLREAVRLAPEHADARFQLARALEAASRHEEARRAFRAAADLDQNPFRALSSFNESLREIAARHPEVALADAESAFLAAAAPRAPGFDLFLDYVHPTPRGDRLVARSVYEAIAASGAVEGLDPRLGFRVPEDGGYDPDRDPRVQRALYTLFAMMHQHEALVSRARRHAAREDPDWRFAGRWLAVFEPLVEIERRRLAGEVVPEAELARASGRLEAFYARQYPRALAQDARPSP